MLPLIANNLLASIHLLANARACARRALHRGRGAQCARLDEALARNPILATALNPVIGYERAAAIAKRAYAEGRPVFDVALEMSGLERGGAATPARSGRADARRPARRRRPGLSEVPAVAPNCARGSCDASRARSRTTNSRTGACSASTPERSRRLQRHFPTEPGARRRAGAAGRSTRGADRAAHAARHATDAARGADFLSGRAPRGHRSGRRQRRAARSAGGNRARSGARAGVRLSTRSPRHQRFPRDAGAGARDAAVLAGAQSRRSGRRVRSAGEPRLRRAQSQGAPAARGRRGTAALRHSLAGPEHLGRDRRACC